MLNLINSFICAPNKTTILQSLQIMWKGMLAIFIAIGLIYIAIYTLNTVTKKISEKKQKNKSDKTEDK